ncbi:MAG: hypothetical protein ACOCUO_02980 [archaeon]
MPEDSPTIDGDTLDALESHLTEHAVGRDNAIVSDALAEVIDTQDDHDTNPTVREAVRVLLSERGVPVASGPRGYYVVADESELDAEIQSIRDRIGSLNARMIALKQARESWTWDETADTQRCDACGGEIAGDPWLWFDYELCRECHDAAPGLRDATAEFVENGGASA